jgi:antitoxin component HigA of HigAB toxin-antitoxin module
VISEKTYRRYLRAITVLMDLDPKPGSKTAKRLISMAKKVETYEKVKYPLDHTHRKLRADLVYKGNK